jgi:hypothetical protein
MLVGILGYGNFAQRFGHDAIDITKDTRNFQTDPNVSISDSRLNWSWKIFSLSFPDGIARGLPEKLHGRVRDCLECQ